jgi:DNA-binding NarL/FixJ family response regulator
MKPIRVLLADEHVLMREGLRLILERSAEMEIVGEASTGREVLHQLKTVRPDIVLMDIRMEDLTGLEATAYISKHFPQVRVLILSVHDDEFHLRQAMQAGAAGYLVKDAAGAELILALKAVAQGKTYLSPTVAQYLMTDYRRRLHGKTKEKEQDLNPGEFLTSRQREVLQLIAEGRTTKEIAVQLSLSENTVETHRRRLMDRLKVRDVTGLVRAAIRLRVITPDR